MRIIIIISSSRRRRRRRNNNKKNDQKYHLPRSWWQGDRRHCMILLPFQNSKSIKTVECEVFFFSTNQRIIDVLFNQSWSACKKPCHSFSSPIIRAADDTKEQKWWHPKEKQQKHQQQLPGLPKFLVRDLTQMINSIFSSKFCVTTRRPCISMTCGNRFSANWPVSLASWAS